MITYGSTDLQKPMILINVVASRIFSPSSIINIRIIYTVTSSYTAPCLQYSWPASYIAIYSLHVYMHMYMYSYIGVCLCHLNY